MTEQDKKWSIEAIKKGLDYMWQTWLLLDSEWNIGETVYNEQDLFNASLVFMHIIGNISAWYCLNEKWMTIEQASEIANELGKNIRQTILLSTWIDTHNI